MAEGDVDVDGLGLVVVFGLVADGDGFLTVGEAAIDADADGDSFGLADVAVEDGTDLGELGVDDAVGLAVGCGGVPQPARLRAAAAATAITSRTEIIEVRTTTLS